MTAVTTWQSRGVRDEEGDNEVGAQRGQPGLSVEGMPPGGFPCFLHESTMARGSLSRRWSWLQTLQSAGGDKTIVRNALWLWMASQGQTAVEIAEFEGVPVRTVRYGIAVARQVMHMLRSGDDEDPDCIPCFGCGPWTCLLNEFRDQPGPGARSPSAPTAAMGS